MNYVLVMVTAFLFLMVPVTADSGSLEVNTDVDSVPIYIDGSFAGVTPLFIQNISSGYHLVSASPEGFFQQTQNISIIPGEVTHIMYIFISSDEQIPAMVRIGECVGTPQPSALDGTSYDLNWISDDILMAYFSGRDEGIECMKSSDGILWDRIADSCLETTSKGSEFRNDPWVFHLPDGTYRMIFNKPEEKGHHLYSASSPDGIHFSGEEIVNLVPSEGSNQTINPTVPSGIVYPDGTIRIYYAIHGAGIQSAISEDMGISWKLEEGSRIEYGTDPTLMLLPDGKTGIIYVDTTPKSKGQRIFFSLSEDGLDFSRYHPIQILESIEPGVWLMDPEIVTDGKVYYVYFSVMGIEGMQNHGLPGTLRSVIDLDCLEKSVMQTV